MNIADADMLNFCVQKWIYSDNTLPENSKEDIVKALTSISKNEEFIRKLVNSKKNWLEIDEKIIFDEIINYINRSLK